MQNPAWYRCCSIQSAVCCTTFGYSFPMNRRSTSTYLEDVAEDETIIHDTIGPPVVVQGPDTGGVYTFRSRDNITLQWTMIHVLIQRAIMAYHRRAGPQR